MLELILALILGIVAGTFTGLAPGIHINLIAALLVSSVDKFPTSGIVLAIFIVAMSITHTFLDFIPSIFLGAPEEDTFLAILPGHEMFLQGQGFQAVILTLYGSLFALIIIILYTPLFIFFLPSFYTLIKAAIPFLLIFISLYLIFRESQPFQGALVFLLAGFLGYATFNLPIKEPLLPLLIGLFGTSALLMSLSSKANPKPQTIIPIKEIKLTKKEFWKAALAASVAAPLCSFLPGIGSGHAAVLGSELWQQPRKSFLFLVGAINTIIMALSFVTIFAIGRARSGSAAAIQTLLHKITLHDLLILLGTNIIAGSIAFFLGIIIAKFFAKSINKINYAKLTWSILGILIIINLIFSNWLGLLVLITSTALGVYTIAIGSKRINLMGALIIPAIIYYLVN